MILGAEVVLLIVGVYALFTGKLPRNKKSKYIVQGWPARVIGIIGLLPLPVSFVVGAAIAILFVAQGKEVTNDSFFWVATAIEGSIVLLCVVAIAIVSRVYRTPLPAHA